MRSICSPYVEKGKIRIFFKKKLFKNELGIAQPEQNLLRILTEVVKRTLPITGYLFELGLVKSPECDRCKQATETTSHFCD